MDEVDWDFVESLHPDVAGKILRCVDDPADIVRASSVSRAWRDFVISNGICKHLCVRLFPQLYGISRVVDISNIQQKCADVGSSGCAEVDYLKKEHRVFASLARGLTSSEVGECLSDATSASSTDNYPEEGVHNTLVPGDRIGRSASYWSSTGQSNPEVPERLNYKLISDLCIVTEIDIQPFQAFFQSRSPIYSSRAVRFRMGHRVLPDDGGDDEDDLKKGHGGQPPADDNFVWTYTSVEFPMTQENRHQEFKLPEPVLCIGGIVQIELLGRIQRQEMDDLLYICVAHVKVLGRPLAPVFRVNPLDVPGKFSLVFNPQAELCAPPIIPEDPYGTVTPENVQRHFRGWEQILNIFRRNSRG